MICLMSDHLTLITEAKKPPRWHYTTPPLPLLPFFLLCLPCLGARERERGIYVALQESWQRSNPLRRQHFHWSEQMETCQVTTATGRPVRQLRVQAAEESAWGLAAGASGWSCVGWKWILQKSEICLRKMSTVLNKLNKSLIRHLNAFNKRDSVKLCIRLEHMCVRSFFEEKGGQNCAQVIYLIDFMHLQRFITHFKINSDSYNRVQWPW